MSERITLHCPRCRKNVDAVICPRHGVMTIPGRLREQPERHRMANAHTASAEPTVYTLHLKLIREGGVDVEAS